MRVNRLETLKNFVVNGQIQTQILVKMGHFSRLLEPPIAQGATVPLHHDIVVLVVYAIVIEVSHTGLKPKFFQTRDFSENVVQDTAVMDCFGKLHLLDSNVLGLCELGFAFIDDSIRSFCQFLPSLAVTI